MTSPSKKRRALYRKLLHKHIPITKWLPEYNRDKCVADIIAGVTVGLTVIPQALAYATLAGLEPQYGLYSSLVGCFVYALFGSCKDITIGPTALMALMTYQQIAGKTPQLAVFLCLLTGVVQLLMGILHLGVLIDFISIPVTVGFTSATSVIIATSQIKGLFGLKFTSSGFIDNLRKIFQNIHNLRLADTSMGFLCIVFLLFMRKLKDLKLTNRPALNKTLWLLSTSRNALVVLFCSLMAWYYERYQVVSPFILTGTVRAGLPELSLPPFETTIGNRTLGFVEMFSELGTSILLVPIIGVLGNVAIAKAFSSGSRVDATQELITLSLCNVLGSFISSMPVTGSFSRSAVNHASGVATQLGGIYTGVLVLLALSLLTPYFYFIPKAALAAVVICAVVFMIEYEVVKPIWRSRRADLAPAVCTFVVCLVIGVELGIVIGVAVNIALLLYPSARPHMHSEYVTNQYGMDYVLVRLGCSLYFPGVEHLRNYACRKTKHGYPLVIDCSHVLGVDFTAAKGLCALSSEISTNYSSRLIVLCPNTDVYNVLNGVSNTLSVVRDESVLQSVLSETMNSAAVPLLADDPECGTDREPPPSYLEADHKMDNSLNDNIKEGQTSIELSNGVNTTNCLLNNLA